MTIKNMQDMLLLRMKLQVFTNCKFQVFCFLFIKLEQRLFSTVLTIAKLVELYIEQNYKLLVTSK